ncbi:hypothetical protein [Streptomyces alboflavus]|uniref:hypothetical protein n=1 Tax=Streptomyces alboflavus TaxID=67267 RepID=UPI0036803AA4
MNVQQQYWAPIHGQGQQPRTICPRQCGGLLCAEKVHHLVKWVCNNPRCGWHAYS